MAGTGNEGRGGRASSHGPCFRSLEFILRLLRGSSKGGEQGDGRLVFKETPGEDEWARGRCGKSVKWRGKLAAVGVVTDPANCASCALGVWGSSNNCLCKEPGNKYIPGHGPCSKE